jgi:ATP/maltotriose-dependent transcriptional regulator MalT
MLADVLLVQDRQAQAEQILDRAERMVGTAPAEFRVILWVRRARLHRLRRELAAAAELLDRSAQALDTEMLLPERVVWYVERVALAQLQGRPAQALSSLEDLQRRANTAGMAIPPWEIRYLPRALVET